MRRTVVALVGMVVLLLGAGGSAEARENPVTNGSFEHVDSRGRPSDWEPLGNARVSTDRSHSGQRALHLVRTPDTTGEVGLNRAWKPRSGQRDAMLAQRRGGITFRYDAVASSPPGSLTFQIIPMNDKPLEVGGNRVVWRIPDDHVGDGKWHLGKVAYNFENTPDVEWVHVGARLLGTSGELWLDDIAWVDHVGPVLQVDTMTITETPGHEGTRGTLEVAVRNLGDRTASAGSAVLTTPDSLTPDNHRRELAEIPPGGTVSLTWRLTGRRQGSGQRIAVAVAAGNATTAAALELAPEIVFDRLEAERMILNAVNDTMNVHLLARNQGTAFAEGLHVSLSAPAELAVAPVGDITPPPPGSTVRTATWKVTATRALPWGVLEVTGPDAGPEPRLHAPVVCLDAPVESVQFPDRDGCYSEVLGKAAVIGNESIRLLLAGGADGAFRHAALQVGQGSAWQTVAHIPKLGVVATPEAEQPLAAATAVAHRSADRAVLDLNGTCMLGSTTWETAWRFTVAADWDRIDLRLNARPGADADITAFEGPMLYLGEKSDAPRRDAILPGLEWLVEGEESSNALDIRPDHHDRMRHVPHPNKITVPAVGMRIGSTTVGLLWSTPQHQPSADLAGPLSLAFATPNRFEGHRNHLMGLFLPAVGNGLRENRRRADRPLTVPAGRELVIEAGLFASPAADAALAVLDCWYRIHGFPEPLPYPRATAIGEIEFSLQGYFEPYELWNPEWKRWYSDLIVGFRPTDRPAAELLWGTRFVRSDTVREKALDMVRRAWGPDPAAWEARIQHRTNPEALRASARSVSALVASQHDDGTWRFGGEKAGEWPENGVNYKVLGPVGASEVGLTAGKATSVLEFALLTGDRAAADAGLRALRAMRQFRVPRAAQVWEVPVHTPDILASARAVQACLAGYRLTDDAQWLRDAVYWARTGLPFVYVWHTPEHPSMQGASIPVFGATAYVLSWFAVAVQWNGLAYGSALFDLARYDSSFPWKRVAENILRSAMYQQATTGDRFAQWPDALNYIAGRPGPHGQTPPCFQPGTILRQTYRLLGAPMEPAVVPVRAGDRLFALRGLGTFTDARFADDTLTFELVRCPPQGGAVELIGVTRPRRVTFGRTRLHERPVLWQGEQPGWTYHGDIAILEIRPGDAARALLEIEGSGAAPVSLLPSILTSVDFSFERSPEGWSADNHLRPLRIVDGRLTTVTTGHDPYISRGALDVQTTPEDRLLIRISLSGGGTQTGSVFWATEFAPGFAANRQVHFDIPCDGRVHEISVPVGTHPQWPGGTLTGLRIDPGSGHTGTTVTIGRIRLTH